MQVETGNVLPEANERKRDLEFVYLCERRAKGNKTQTHGGR